VRTVILPVNPVAPELEVIAQAADVLRAGGLVAFPTETVYGLGANALDAAAVARIFVAKGRPANNPLIVHVAERSAARVLVAAWPLAAERLAERFWPGPLTLVLPRSAAVPDIVTAGGPTVAVRMPAHAVARALISAAGVPLAAPSANRSTRLSPTRAEHVMRDLDGRVDLVLDGGPTPGGLESTVLDVGTSPPQLLRPGLIAPGEIAAIIGPIEQRIEQPVADPAPLPAPGMMARHYAPRAPLELADDGGRRIVEAHCRAHRSVAWLTFEEVPPNLPQQAMRIVMPRDPALYASSLYAVLHTCDDAGVERIVVALPPDTEDWLAVRDRLRRAAAPG
jgi:L-threonylcarbamoyladenylate synthase